MSSAWPWMAPLDLDAWLRFVATTALVTASPGPSTLLVMARRLEAGRGAAAATIAGDLTANLGQMVVAASGLGWLVGHGDLWLAIQWLGVATIAWLGLRRLLSPSAATRPRRDAGSSSGRSSFWRGFLVSAANPKAIAFFAALYPPFISPSHAYVPQAIALGATFLVLDGACLLAYGRLGRTLGSCPRGRERSETVAGGALLVASGLMAARTLSGGTS